MKAKIKHKTNRSQKTNYKFYIEFVMLFCTSIPLSFYAGEYYKESVMLDEFRQREDKWRKEIFELRENHRVTINSMQETIDELQNSKKGTQIVIKTYEWKE